jgi:hypothetical protein
MQASRLAGELGPWLVGYRRPARRAIAETQRKFTSSTQPCRPGNRRESRRNAGACQTYIPVSYEVDASVGSSLFGQKTGASRAAALVTMLVDWADHYSTAASYLRLNGLLPPSAVPKK